ncbi:MAG: DUF1848 family protein [Deltaproteobacteria bacterium]|nr:DUF1848 family protein [Deltaproteobacteria bacterium]NIS76495.1 DUF1848 family protein [Deltaproteobacteria bacterium]
MGEIVSVSRRTDIPAFHWEWFARSLEGGSVSVKNPFSGRPYTVSLLPEDVACFVFWTKNPAPALGKIEELAGKGQPVFFHVTINGYGGFLEKKVPSWRSVAGAVRDLSDVLGKDRVFWRFDPLLPFEEGGRTLARFRRIADSISHRVSRCYVATFHPYVKAARRLSAHDFPEKGGHDAGLLRKLLSAGREYGLHMLSCASAALAEAGFEKGACIDGEYLLGFVSARGGMKKNPTRPGCGCTDSRDIGTYGSCRHACLYCYAT